VIEILEFWVMMLIGWVGRLCEMLVSSWLDISMVLVLLMLVVIEI